MRLCVRGRRRPLPFHGPKRKKSSISWSNRRRKKGIPNWLRLQRPPKKLRILNLPRLNGRTRRAAILKRIRKGILKRKKKKQWKLSRAIWRAGDLKLAEVVEHLDQLVGNDALTDYSIVYALGRTGQESSAPILKRIIERYQKQERKIRCRFRE